MLLAITGTRSDSGASLATAICKEHSRTFATALVIAVAVLAVELAGSGAVNAYLVTMDSAMGGIH